MSGSWPIPSSRTTAGRSRASLLLALVALFPFTTFAIDLREVSTRDRRVVARWKIDAAPAALALIDGRLFVGLSDRQSLIEIDPESGKVARELVLDNPEIASTKELVSIRPSAGGDRLVIANGSDESVTVVSLPQLTVAREITLEGEAVSDAIPDPQGRYLYILGRKVRIFDGEGERELRTLHDASPMAIAVSSDGRLLAVIGSDDYPGGAVTTAAIYETSKFEEISRQPLQTDRVIRAATFAAGDSALVVLASDWLGEKSLATPGEKKVAASGGTMRMKIEAGDLVSSEKICLPDKAGVQIAALADDGRTLYFVERRCPASGSFTAAPRRVRAASLFGYPAHSIALDHSRKTLWVTDPAGFITSYRLPKVEERK